MEHPSGRGTPARSRLSCSCSGSRGLGDRHTGRVTLPQVSHGEDEAALGLGAWCVSRVPKTLLVFASPRLGRLPSGSGCRHEPSSGLPQLARRCSWRRDGHLQQGKW